MNVLMDFIEKCLEAGNHEGQADLWGYNSNGVVL